MAGRPKGSFKQKELKKIRKNLTLSKESVEFLAKESEDSEKSESRIVDDCIKYYQQRNVLIAHINMMRMSAMAYDSNENVNDLINEAIKYYFFNYNRFEDLKKWNHFHQRFHEKIFNKDI